MNIAYSTDETYVRHVFVSLNSLLDKNQDEKSIIIYIIDNNIRKESKLLLEKLVDQFVGKDRERLIKFIEFNNFKQYVKNAVPWGSLSTYGRLFLETIEGIDKILYLDCDTVVCGALSTLYSINIENYALAAVQDNAGPKFRETVGLKWGDRYINAGVCLINLQYWKKHKIMDKCLRFINDFNGQVPCADQGTLNGVLKNKILIISPKYNVMTPMFDFSGSKMKIFFELNDYYTDIEIQEAIENPVIVHYTGGFSVRPWYINGNHPMQKIYRYYMDKSPWKNQYLPKYRIGLRTELMKICYKILPFRCFIFIHRFVRFIIKRGNKIET